MRNLRALTWLSFALRGLLVMAVLAIAPLYETAHPMTDAAGTMAMMPQMAAHDMTMSAAAQPEQMPASHASLGAACRILCFGWVEAPAIERQEGPVFEIALVLAPSPSALLVGIAPPPNGHPPKSASFV